MEILERTETRPLAFPPVPSGLSAAAAALDGDAIWERLEAYVAWRWSERPCEWVVQGPGSFVPDLKPFVIDTTEIWEGLAWTSTTLDPSPRSGVTLHGCGPYRVTCTVGGGDVPAAVEEAYRRLAEYSARVEEAAGAMMHTVTTGPITVSEQRAANWKAKALQNSGAADLLRPYRRA